MRLCQEQLGRLPEAVTQPRYDRSRVEAGIVHLGTGVFHRSHLAAFADSALEHCTDLGMCGVSLRSAAARDALRPQDFLYTLMVVGEEPSFRVIGSLLDILHAPEDPGAVVRRMAGPGVHTVTVTVTEAGYHLDSDGTLDLQDADIVADLQSPRAPRTTIGVIAAALRERRDHNIGPLAVVSCDNLAGNGRLLGDGVIRFATEVDPGLAAWIRDEVAFPCTMVDSITPSTDAALRRTVSDTLGMVDVWPVRREAFAQWVVEDGLLPHQDIWTAVGVTFSADVESWEMAKLRLLNGQHSAMAYLGILAGLHSVYDAISDPDLRAFLAVLARQEIQPSLRSSSGFDVDAYVADLARRFANPAIDHQLEKIACDGSLKIPIRTLSVIHENLEAGRPVRCLCLVVAAWLNFLGTRNADGSDLGDPLAADLLTVFEVFRDDTSAGVRALLSIDRVCDEQLRGDARLFDCLVAACEVLKDARGPAVAARVREYLALTDR